MPAKPPKRRKSVVREMLEEAYAEIIEREKRAAEKDEFPTLAYLSRNYVGHRYRVPFYVADLDAPLEPGPDGETRRVDDVSPVALRESFDRPTIDRLLTEPDKTLGPVRQAIVGDKNAAGFIAFYAGLGIFAAVLFFTKFRELRPDDFWSALAFLVVSAGLFVRAIVWAKKLERR